MQLINLDDERPPAYRCFTSYNKNTGEYFKNYLILSKHNKFYVAGKEFTHWLKERKINQLTIQTTNTRWLTHSIIRV